MCSSLPKKLEHFLIRLWTFTQFLFLKKQVFKKVLVYKTVSTGTLVTANKGKEKMI